MVIFRNLLLGILVLCSLNGNCQQFGGIYPGIRWDQINTDTARIIFPSGLKSEAEKVAAIVYQLGLHTVPTIGGRQKKIDIIFQNQTTISNGYVQLAPFRSEFQLTADQNSFELGSLPWEEQLAIHEYRHVEQYSNFRVGLSRWFYYLFGEGGQEVANSLSIPNWFWEGDAVYQETLVSRQGRGRLPFYFNGYRSLWAAGKNYSWMKLRNGSLRDYVPDHYPLGYMEVAYGRERFGENFWKKVCLDAAAFRGVFYPLQKGIRRYSGQSFELFRDSALDYFSKNIHFDTANNVLDGFAARQRHFVADEEFPHLVDNSHLLYVRTSYRRPHVFVMRDLANEKEEVLRTRSVSLDNYFSYSDGKIVYAAYEPDLRWGWKDFNVLRIMDLKSGKDWRITRQTKYFSPAFSSDGLRIVTVNESEDGESELLILDGATGRVEKRIPNPQHLFYTFPKFLHEGQIVTAVRNERGEMALALISTDNGVPVYLTHFSMNPIGFPSVSGDTIYFTASYLGKDRLFASVAGNLYKVITPISNPNTGDYALVENQGRLAWSSFTAVGYTISTASQASFRFEPIEAASLAAPLLTQGLKGLENGPSDLLDSVPQIRYRVSSYPKNGRLINFHSWRPYINDPVYNFALVSENVLSTLQSEVFVAYNRNEQSVQLGTDATYGALFPWIDAGVDYTFDRNALIGNQKIYWNELQARAGLTLPFNFSKGRDFTNLQVGSDLVYNQRYYTGSEKNVFGGQGFFYVDPVLNFVHQVQSAPMQIYPRWAQTLTINYNQAVTTYNGYQFLASGYFYFPGLTRLHSLLLGAAFQQRDSLNEIRFSNNFPFSRGYTAENFYRMYRLTANYQFPIWYPDWGFGNLVYFLRIRANIYYDYTRVLDYFTDGTRVQPDYRSTGAEIYFDTKWWNQLALSFGIRYSRLLDPDFEGRGPNQWEFILPLTLLSR